MLVVPEMMGALRLDPLKEPVEVSDEQVRAPEVIAPHDKVPALVVNDVQDTFVPEIELKNPGPLEIDEHVKAPDVMAPHDNVPALVVSDVHDKAVKVPVPPVIDVVPEMNGAETPNA
jgi:hypothetical protein